MLEALDTGYGLEAITALRQAQEALVQSALQPVVPDASAAISGLSKSVALQTSPPDFTQAVQSLQSLIALFSCCGERNWGVISDTHVNRALTPAGGLNLKRLYYETDRTALYVSINNAWVYAGGVMSAAWASLPGDLTTTDNGFLFFDNTNSLHVWQWTGAAWNWGPGDTHSGMIGMFDANPGTGWHAADGSTVTKYAANGTRNAAFVLPDMREFYLKASATYTGSGVAAVAPTISGQTEDTTIGFTPAAAAGGVSFTTGTALAGATQLVVTDITDPGGGGGGGSLNTDPHHHLLTSADAPISNTGTPPTFAVLPYYRL